MYQLKYTNQKVRLKDNADLIKKYYSLDEISNLLIDSYHKGKKDGRENEKNEQESQREKLKQELQDNIAKIAEFLKSIKDQQSQLFTHFFLLRLDSMKFHIILPILEEYYYNTEMRRRIHFEVMTNAYKNGYSLMFIPYSENEGLNFEALDADRFIKLPF